MWASSCESMSLQEGARPTDEQLERMLPVMLRKAVFEILETVDSVYHLALPRG